MLIENIDKDFYEKHIKKEFSEDSQVNMQAEDKLRFRSTEFSLDSTFLEWEELESLYDIAKKNSNRSLMIQISSIRNLLEDIENSKIPNLKAFATGLVAYFSDNLIDGWLYKVGGDKVPNPYLIRDVRYMPATHKDDRAYVKISLMANSASSSNKTQEISVSFDSDDIRGKTITQLLAQRGYYHESPELKEMYTEHVRLFHEYQPQFNKQFVIQGEAFEEGRYGREVKVNLNNAKAVNDEEIVSRKFKPQADPRFWRVRDVEEGFTDIPYHCYIYLFNLQLHNNMWVHVTNMKPYVYDTSLREKLVLPQHHRDLIDILVADIGILMEDIIKGKSGGTTILCEGKPGLGKTLSAEVYSEVIEKPLYKVHSGQLGLTADSVEQSLEKILKRASRWGAVLLLDEADVYIRARGNDLQHNAVVAGFLRTLEYFDGLLFMTTNRGDDVDDAILSRCIAVIKYETPSQEDAKKIWRVLANQFQVDLSDELIEQLTVKFPKVSGRDIKELLKLTSRYAKGKNVPLDVEVFRQCAQFRGVEIVG
jgi:hypothetical protein